MAYLFFALGVAVLAVGAVFAYLRRHDTTACITCILLGIFLSTILMVFPTHWLEADKDLESRGMYALLLSVFYALDTIGGGQNIGQIESMPLAAPWKTLYIVLNYCCFLLAPILTSGMILSFVGDWGERLKKLFTFARHYHIFSELNENTVSLAEGIRKSSKRSTVIFCSTKDCDGQLSLRAKKLGGILLYKSCQGVRLGMVSKNATFYVLEDDEDACVGTAVELVKKHRNTARHKVTVNVFADNDSSIKVSENMEKGSVRLQFVNPVVLQCYHLLEKYPLYKYVDGQGLLSVMLIGAGNTVQQMLKAVAWCGQMPGCRLKIRVYDCKAEEIRKTFFATAPELLKEEYDIRFITADVTTVDFQNLLREHSPDAAYGVIAMGDDGCNIATADSISGIFRRENGFAQTPLLLTRIRNEAKIKNYTENGYLQARGIVPFGDVGDIYTENTLFNTRLERLAQRVHLCYWDKLDAPEEACGPALESFYDSAYNRRSSMATALHMDTKIHFAQKMRQQGMQDEEILEILAQNEHKRWNAFMRSEGYTLADDNALRQFAPVVKKDRDDRSKLHSCLRNWEELDGLSVLYNSLRVDEKQRDFKENDYMIIRNIPVLMEEKK